MKHKIICVLLIVVFAYPVSLYAIVDPNDTAAFMSGFRRLAMSAFQLPFRTIQGTLNGPIGIGTVQGLVSGTIQTVTDMVGGAFNMAAASAPYAKYAALAL